MAGVSVLSSLDSIFAASLAINLAYLNLDQFRYRNEMAAMAKEKTADPPDAVRSKQWFRDIKSLADQLKAEPAKLTLPRTAWGFFYRVFFHWKTDRAVSVALTIVSATYLFAGVSFDVGYLPQYAQYFEKTEILNELIYAGVGLFWPMLMVSIATICISSCAKFVKYQFDDIAQTELETGSKDIDAATSELDAKAADEMIGPRQ